MRSRFASGCRPNEGRMHTHATALAMTAILVVGAMAERVWAQRGSHHQARPGTWMVRCHVEGHLVERNGQAGRHVRLTTRERKCGGQRVCLH
jgi:hypothetical protein